MKESKYKDYSELPLFLKAKTGAPAGTQRSGSGGGRRSSGMSEPWRLRRGEGYGACDDEAKVLGVSPSTGYELMHDPSFPVLRVGSLNGVPAKAHQSFCGERRRSETSELSGLPGSERCGACADDVPKEKFRAWVEKNTAGGDMP